MDGILESDENSGARPQFDKIVRNDFGQPKAGPQGETHGCVSQSLQARHLKTLVSHRLAGVFTFWLLLPFWQV